MFSANDVSVPRRKMSTPSPGQKSARRFRRAEGMRRNQFVPESEAAEGEEDGRHALRDIVVTSLLSGQ